MGNKNIIFNHTLEQYNKKYKNRNYRLLKYTKKELQDFAKRNNCEKEYLLKNHTWWFINNTYYEIPKPIRFTWFRNLNAGIQTGVCLLGAGVVATAITVPLVLMNKKEDTPIVDPTKENEAVISEGTKTDEGMVYKVSPKDSSKKKISGIESVYIGNDKLEEVKEYNVKQVEESVELTIKQVAFENHKGTVKVTPKVEDKTPESILVEDIKLSDATMVLEGEGDQDKIIATVLPENATKKDLKWASSDPSIVEVDDQGKLTVKSIPNPSKTITITVSATDGSNKKATCEVEVSNILGYEELTDADNELIGYEFYTIDQNITKAKIPSTHLGKPVLKCGECSASPWNTGFERCKNLSSVTFSKLNNMTETGKNCFTVCSSLKAILLPNNLNTINENAFYKSALESIELSNIKIIENYAFSYTPVKSIVLPSTLETLGKSSFAFCSSLESINIPSTITTIKVSTFEDCSVLNNVILPSTITSIDDLAFSGCTTLDNLSFAGTKVQWSNVTKSEFWHDDIPATVIHCSDGDADLD